MSQLEALMDQLEAHIGRMGHFEVFLGQLEALKGQLEAQIGPTGGSEGPT